MILKYLRWIFLVPCTFISTILVPPLYELIMSFIVKIYDVPYPSGNFLIGFVFVMASVLIAPSHKFKVSIVFTCFSILSGIYFLIGYTSAYFKGSTFDIVLSCLGSLFAFFLIFMQEKDLE